MEGCGATICPSRIFNCEDCLALEGSDAAGQYAWVPETNECVGTCLDAPADASCYQARSIDNPNGYDPSICRDLEQEECPDRNPSQCRFDPSRPYVCGSEYECPMDNLCAVDAAGYDELEDCCQAPDPAGCSLIYQPVVCGSKACPYSSLCQADLAGYKESQCSSGTGTICEDYDNCSDCLDGGICSWSPDVNQCLNSCDEIADAKCYSPEYGFGVNDCPITMPCEGYDGCRDCLDAKCAWSPEAGSGNGACFDDCRMAPADASCYSPEFGHDADTCPAEDMVWLQAAPTLSSRKTKDFFGSENNLDASGARFLVSAKKSSEASGLSEAGMVRVYDVNNNGRLSQVGQTLYGFRNGDEIQGVLSKGGQRLVMYTPRRDDDTGRIWVYELKNGEWFEIGKILGKEGAGERFGNAAAISKDGQTIAIGASFANSKRGLVRVYRYRGGTFWEQLGSDITGNFVDGKFGWDIDFASEAKPLTFVVGQKSDDAGDDSGRPGQVRVFRYNSNQGRFVQKGDPIVGQNPGDSFGRQVAMSADGTIFAAGAKYYGRQNAGAADVFEDFGNGSWSQLGGTVTGDSSNDEFGNVAINAAGNRMAVGGGAGSSKFGYVKVFDYKSGRWTQVGNTLEGQAYGENFGSNISLSPDGSTLLVGSPSRDNSNLPGSVRIYKLVPMGTYSYPYTAPEIQSAEDDADAAAGVPTENVSREAPTTSPAASIKSAGLISTVGTMITIYLGAAVAFGQ